MRYESIDQLPAGIRKQLEKQMVGSNSANADRIADAQAKDPAAQWRGLTNREAGQQWETILTAGCEHYLYHKVAHIQKTPEPMAPIKSMENNRFLAVFTEKAQCDYKGTLAGGRSVAFEAKHTSSERIEKKVVSPKQEAWLVSHHQLGALCFVMVSMNFEQYYRIPLEDWLGMQQIFGRKYMTMEDLTPYEVPIGLCDALQGGRQSGVKFLQGLDVEVRV